ncbi:MAG: 4-coumarate--CoA ligase [Rhodobacteraceae bacterium]|jgi:4-coumarate--CoA ligase|nr:4-coumarate--CoA ligase [Paracoccaceae bacterium]
MNAADPSAVLAQVPACPGAARAQGDGFAGTHDTVRPGPDGAVLTAGQIARVLAALLQADILRDTGRTVARARILGTPRLDEDGLGLDSLARLRAIATVTEFFGLAVTGLEDYLVVDPRLCAWTEIVGHHISLRGALTELTFTTSGSSGLAPKRAPHSLGDLVAEVDSVAEVLSDTGAGAATAGFQRVLASVPPHHIYGFLFTVILPDRQGHDVVDLSELPASAGLRAAGTGDLIVGTPFTWQLACDADARARTSCTGLVSTAPMPPQLWAQVHTAGVGRLVEVFGSSETSGIGWRDTPQAPFQLLPHLGRAGDVPTRNMADLPLQDRLDWIGPRSFRLGGRIDGAVQIGGLNVAPAAVADVLARVDGVAEVSVRLDGDRLKAFVVPAPGIAGDPSALEERLREVAVQNLAPPARPARYTFGPSLPRSAIGKLVDWDARATPTV